MTLTSFTDQKARIATKKDCNGIWGGQAKGKRFRCYLCGHKFILGDIWRWVYSKEYTNFLVCDKCDGEDVMDRWYKANKELNERFWWALKEDY